MSLATSFSMFFLSFAPLWVSILFIDSKSIIEKQTGVMTEKYSILVILIISIISLVILMLSFNKKNADGSQEYTINDIEEEKALSAEYLLSYILPLFAFDFTVWHQVVLFLVFFFVLAFLCIRHNYFSVNILLELLGYRFYRCTLQNEDGVSISKVVISKERLLNRKTERILIHPINNEYSADIQKWK